MLPIARWLSHHMLWMMGYNYDRVLQELYHDVVHNDFENDSNDESSLNYDSDEDSLDGLDNGVL